MKPTKKCGQTAECNSTSDLFLVWYTIDPCVLIECHPSPPPQNKGRRPCLRMTELFLPCSSNTHLLISSNSRCFCFLQVEWPPTLILLPAFCFIVLLLIIWMHNGFWLRSLIISSYKEKISHKVKTKQNQGPAIKQPNLRSTGHWISLNQSLFKSDSLW